MSALLALRTALVSQLRLILFEHVPSCVRWFAPSDRHWWMPQKKFFNRNNFITQVLRAESAQKHKDTTSACVKHFLYNNCNRFPLQSLPDPEHIISSRFSALQHKLVAHCEKKQVTQNIFNIHTRSARSKIEAVTVCDSLRCLNNPKIIYEGTGPNV